MVVVVLGRRHLILISSNLLRIDQLEFPAHRQGFDLSAAGLSEEIGTEAWSRGGFAQSVVSMVTADQDLFLTKALCKVLSEGCIFLELVLDLSSDVAQIDGGLIKRPKAFLDFAHGHHLFLMPIDKGVRLRPRTQDPLA